jgi:hypothetical protein
MVLWRGSQIDEVHGLAAYLTSPVSGFITGSATFIVEVRFAGEIVSSHACSAGRCCI